MRPDRAGRRVPRWIRATLGYALLLVAWAFASPLGAGPDEPSHMVRAAAAGLGQLEGRPVAPYQRTEGLTPAQADYLNRQTQQFSIPARLVPPSTCFLSSPDSPADCLNTAGVQTDTGSVLAVSYSTTAPPFVYVLAGRAMRLALIEPGYLGRLALGLVCALFLGAAAWAVSGRGSLWPALGLSLGITPMVLFLGSSLTPAGVAVCATVCLAAAAVGLWTGPFSLRLLALATLSGAAVALVRPSGLAALAAVSVAVLPLVRARHLPRLAALLAAAAVAGSAILELGWMLNHQPPLPLGGAFLTDAIPPVIAQWPALLEQSVGVFGWGDVHVPAAITAAWSILSGLLVGAALVVAGWRERIALVLAGGALVILAAAEYAVILSPLGWDLQARYFLSVATLLPLLGGYALHRAGALTRADAFLVGLAVAAMQFAAFWENARRYAVGRHGALYFLDAAQWTPPGGWLPWVVLAAAGCVLVALSLAPLTVAEQREASGSLIDTRLVSVSR